MAETLPSCAERLEAAKLAMHKLMTGESEVSVGYGDRNITFRAADVEQLRVYIRELEQECGDCTKRRRPFGMAW